jgi:putative hemolysin
MIGLILLTIGLLIAGSILLTAADAAVFSLSDGRVRTLRDEGFRGATKLLEARDRKTRIQTATLLISTVLNGLAIGALLILTTTQMQPGGTLLFRPALPVSLIFSGIVALLLLTEFLPRLFLARTSIRMALKWAPFLLTMERALGPILHPFLPGDARGNGRDGDEDEHRDEREVREMSALGRLEGVVGEDEEQLVERVFRLDERSAWDVMTPRVDIFSWKDDTLLKDIIEALQEVPHSRVPVYGESVDDITGILNVREAYEAWVAGRGDVPLSSLSREPFFIPGSLPLPRLLRLFQSRRVHLGIVADEFGGTDGLVTLEDVLEELVGEIEDERDVTEERMIRLSPDELEVDASIEIRELNDALDLELPEEEARSLNGLILEELGRVPARGETLILPGLSVRILDASETQVLRVRLTREVRAEEGTAASEETERNGRESLA